MGAGTCICELLVWASFLFGVSSGLPRPAFLYPLGSTSVTYDVTRTSFQPQALQPRTCPILSDSSKEGFDSFHFDGSPVSIADFNLSSGSSARQRQPEFSFAFWLQPDSLHGVFFEYRAGKNATATGTITAIKGELVAGAVRMTISDVTGDLASVTSSKTISTGSWKATTLSTSATTGTVAVILDGEATLINLAATPIIHGVMDSGVLHLGESWTGDSFYLGNINCAAVYLAAIEIAGDVGGYESSCKIWIEPPGDSFYLGIINCAAVYLAAIEIAGDVGGYESSCKNWIEPSDYPTCPVIAVGSYREPVNLWPLDRMSLGFDVTTLTPSLRPEVNGTCPRLDSNKKFNEAGWILDGDQEREVEVSVQGDLYSFSLALYIWSYTDTAVLLNYTTNTTTGGAAINNNNDIASVTVYLTAGHLRVVLRDTSDAVLCNVTSDDPFDLLKWQWVLAAWDYGRGVLTLHANDQVTSFTLPALTRRRLSTPGSLTAGRAHGAQWLSAQPQPFLGLISCLALYNHSVGNHRGDYEKSCKYSDWLHYPVVPDCPVYVTGQYHPPAHLWPLTNATMTYDVIGGTDGVTPNLQTSYRCPVFRDALLTYPAMSFEEGSPAVVLRLPSDTLYYSFTFGAFVGPESLQGRLLEYTTNADVSSSHDFISHVVVGLRDGFVEVNMTSRLGVTVVQMESTEALQLQTAKPLLLAWDLAEGLQLTVDSKTDLSPPASFARLPLGAPGTLRVGGRRGGADDVGGAAEGYAGRLSCLCFFNHTLNKDHVGDIQSECELVVLPAPPLFDTSACSIHPLPSLLWPLNNVTRGHEALSGMAPLSRAAFMSCFRLDHSDASLAGPQLLFDGSLQSNIVVPVNESVLAGDFALVVFVKASAPPEGVLVDYTSSSPFPDNNSSAPPRLARLSVSTATNGSLAVALFFHYPPPVGGVSPSPTPPSAPSRCGGITIPGALNDHVDVWTLVVVHVDIASHRLHVRVNATTWSTAYTCTNGTGLAPQHQDLSGTLELGGRDVDGEGGAGFRGSLRCLMVFAAFDQSAETMSHLEQTCRQQMAAAGSTAANTHQCPDVTFPKQGYRLVARNVQPEPSAHPPIRSLLTRSLVMCAGACVQTVDCRSFVITPVGKTSRVECQMFDRVTKYGLAPSSNAHYYEIKKA